MTFIHTFWVNSGKSKSKNYNQNTIYFGKAICRLLHERSNVTAYIAATHALWLNSGKWKWEKVKSGYFTSCKCYIQGATRKKQSHCFFHGASKISKKVTFTHALWVNNGKSKLEKLKSGCYTCCKCYIQGPSRNKQYHYFFHWEPKISNKKKGFLHMQFGLILVN